MSRRFSVGTVVLVLLRGLFIAVGVDLAIRIPPQRCPARILRVLNLFRLCISSKRLFMSLNSFVLTTYSGLAFKYFSMFWDALTSPKNAGRRRDRTRPMDRIRHRIR